MVSAGGDSLPRRVVTAVVAIPVVIVAVLALPVAGVALVLAAVALGASLEWSRIASPGAAAGRLEPSRSSQTAPPAPRGLLSQVSESGFLREGTRLRRERGTREARARKEHRACLVGLRRGLARHGFALVVAGSLLLSWLAASHWLGWLQVLCAVSLVWWCVALVWVIRFERGRDAAALDGVVARGLAGWFIIVPAWAGLVYLLHARDEHGPWPVLLVFLIVWAADIGAYFAGRRFGSRRLAATTSPGKSIEGVVGGMAAVAGLGTIAGLWLGLPAGLAVAFTVMCTVVGAFSVLGDLMESLVKRRGGVKDSGNVLPGHGGILDRIDSLTAAVPAFAIGTDILGTLR